jgi:hypothetical protein
MGSKFKTYEIVKVSSSQMRVHEIAGKEGVILGKDLGDNGVWGYSIALPEGSWFVYEYEISSTGKFSSEEVCFKDSPITISVDKKGQGDIRDKTHEDDD